MEQAVKPLSSADRVRDRLLEDLQSGKIAPGEAFPPERKMAETLGVSRHILRQALSSLQGLGLVDIRPGSGAYAVESAPDDAVMRVAGALIDREGSIYNILELRACLEPGMARMAAERRTEADLARLEQLIAYLANEDTRLIGGESTSFHREIAKATGNGVFDGVMRTLITGPRRAEGLIKVVPTAKHQWEREHRAIFEAIRDQDGDLAETLMKQHMEGILQKVAELERSAAIDSAPPHNR